MLPLFGGMETKMRIRAILRKILALVIVHAVFLIVLAHIANRVGKIKKSLHVIQLYLSILGMHNKPFHYHS